MLSLDRSMSWRKTQLVAVVTPDLCESQHLHAFDLDSHSSTVVELANFHQTPSLALGTQCRTHFPTALAALRHVTTLQPRTGNEDAC